MNRSFAQVVAGQGGPTTSNDRVADGASVMAHQNGRLFRHTQSATLQPSSAANAVVPPNA